MASPTLAQLRTMVRRDIRDPNTVTFPDADVNDFIDAAIAEVSRIAPLNFFQTIAYALNTYAYVTRMTEVHRVEVWDTLASPNSFVFFVPPAADNNYNSSQAGWEVWAGSLRLPSWLDGLTVGRHSFRVWGYAPYLQLTADADVAEFDDLDLQWAVREYANVRAFEYLLSDRSLFEQWQAQANNTDVSPAAMVNMLQSWQAKWERRRKQLRTNRILP